MNTPEGELLSRTNSGRRALRVRRLQLLSDGSRGMLDVSKAVAEEYSECVHGGQAARQDENPLQNFRIIRDKESISSLP